MLSLYAITAVWIRVGSSPNLQFDAGTTICRRTRRQCRNGQAGFHFPICGYTGTMKSIPFSRTLKMAEGSSWTK
jgi:hypothetical protein